MSLLRADIVSFQRNQNEILRDISLEVELGQHWVLLGPNGSGKSSLIKLLTCYEWPTEGRIEIQGRAAGELPVEELRRSIGLFEPALQLEIGHHYPWITALEIVMTGSTGRLMMFGDRDPDMEERARKLLEEQRLDPDRAFAVMSSGEQRRTILLRCLLGRPEILILDEPYESLDIKARWELEATVDELMTAQTATITAVHRLEEIPSRVTHGILLRGGRVTACGAIGDVMSSRVISQVYDVPVRVWKEGNRFQYERG